MLANHGLRLREEVLDNSGLSMLDGLQTPPRQTDTTARLRRTLDDIDDIVRDLRPTRPRALENRLQVG